MAAKVINTILNLRDNMSGGLVKAARNTKGVSKEMVSATRSVVAFKNKAVSSVTSAAKSFAKLGAAAGGAVAVLAAKAGFSEALDLEGYRLQLETATKDTVKAGEIMQYAIDLANRTPFEGGALVAAASALEMFGLNTQRWLPVLGDAAAATNKEMADVQQGFIKALTTGEFEGLKDTLSITKDMVDSFSRENFGKSFMNSKGQITDLNLLQDALEGLMDSRFSGGMEKQATTMKGLWSTVTGVTKSALANMVGITTDGSIRSGSALELLKGKVSTLAERFQQWQQDGTLERLAQRFDQGLAKGAELAGQGFQWLQNHGDSLLAGLKLLGGAIIGLKLVKLGMDTVKAVSDFAKFAKTVGILTKTVAVNTVNWIHNTVEMGLNKAGLLAHTVATKAAALGTGALAGAQKLLNMAFVASPVGWIVLGVLALVAAGAALYKNWDTVKAKALSLWESAKGVFGGIRDSVVGAFDAAKGKVAGFFSWIGDKLKALDGAIEGVPVIGALYKGIKSAGSWVADRIGGHATGTSYFPGGLTRVNERGGEIMQLPGGTQIIPHDVSRRMAGGTVINLYLTVQGNMVGDEAYANHLGGIVTRQIMRAMRNV